MKRVSGTIIVLSAYKWVLFYVPVLFILLMPNGFCEETIKIVMAVGMADGKTAASRDEALQDALRNAVEQGVGTYVSSETIVKNFTVVEDNIYSKSKGYIKNYDVIREGVSEGIYEVEIKASVMMDKLSDDLESIGLLIEKKHHPRVMVVILSKGNAATYKDIYRESNIHTANQVESMMIEKGFRLVDAGMIRQKKEVETLLIGNDPVKAGKLAKDAGAEILIQGEVKRDFVHQRTLYGRNMRFFSNEIMLKAIETDTAKILFSGYETRPPSGSTALTQLEEATSLLADKMMGQILEQWKNDVYQAGTFQLTLMNANYKSVTVFKESLANIRGVENVFSRSFQSGTAIVEAKYRGSSDELAGKISAISEVSLEVIGVQANTIEIKIVSNQ